VQADGKLMQGGYSYVGGSPVFALVRYNSNGSVDNSFGAGGKVTTDFGPGDDFGGSLAIQPDGKAILAGYSPVGGWDFFAMARYGGSSADTTPPGCSVGAVVSSAGKVYLPMTATDSGSGVARVQITSRSTNVHLESPLGTTVPGNDLVLSPTQSSKVVYAVKNNPAVKAVVELRVTDGAGNVTICDPVIANLEIKKPRKLVRTFNRIPAIEHYVILQNGAPGLSSATLWVNGKVVSQGKLTDGQTVSLDVQSLMRRGRNNSVTIAASGPNGASAVLTIGDASMMPAGAASSKTQPGGSFNLEFAP
jgi:hypothetical protein